MCNLYSITTNQAAIIALFRVVNRYVGNLAPMPGVFPDYPAPVMSRVRFNSRRSALTSPRSDPPPSTAKNVIRCSGCNGVMAKTPAKTVDPQ